MGQRRCDPYFLISCVVRLSDGRWSDRLSWIQIQRKTHYWKVRRLRRTTLSLWLFSDTRHLGSKTFDSHTPQSTPHRLPSYDISRVVTTLGLIPKVRHYSSRRPKNLGPHTLTSSNQILTVTTGKDHPLTHSQSLID